MADADADMRMGGFWRDVARWAVRDWRWKAVALVLAATLYFVIRERIRYTETLIIPLDIDPQAQLAAATIEPLSVAVTVQGTQSEVQRFNNRELRMIVRPSFSEGRAGKQTWLRRWVRSLAGHRSKVGGNTEDFRLSARNLQGTKERIRVIKIEPKTAKVTYDVRGDVELPVAEPVVIGKPHRGRVVVEYAPKTIRVSGSRDQLDEMVANGLQLQTETVDVDGRVQGFKRTLSILQPSVTRLVKFEPAEISAEIKIITDRFTSEFQNVAVLVAGMPGSGSDWSCEPAAVTVRVTGRAEVVNAIQTNQVSALVVIRGSDLLSSNALPVQVVLPFDLAVEAVETDPATVSVAPVALTAASQPGASDATP